MNKTFPILRFLTVIGIVGVVALLFVYAGGWLCPRALKPVSFVNRFQQVSGLHPGFRRNHAKGVCVSGWFDSNGHGASLSRATVFQQGRVPVIGRFSLGGGNPNQADAPSTVRGFGISFMPLRGEEWRSAMINLPVFPFPTPQSFYDQLEALAPDPATGKPDPERAKAFFEKYPESAAAIKVIKSERMSSGFDNSTFNSLNAFQFINAKGETAWVRWSFVPVQLFEPVDVAHPEKAETNYLFDALIASVHQHPLQWHLIITIAQPGDSITDASLPWPSDRRQVDAGTLTINQIESDDTSPARNINFDPLVLPDGIAPSDDPLLSARSAVYSRSFTRREGETKTPSPISSAETEK
ncbi:MAG TPA: catalase family peroxidase [Alphaproteobacteria bacterium]|nr:catalase family peroxidase [Alphaproteobacteria bacterium]